VFVSLLSLSLFALPISASDSYFVQGTVISSCFFQGGGHEQEAVGIVGTRRAFSNCHGSKIKIFCGVRDCLLSCERREEFFSEPLKNSRFRETKDAASTVGFKRLAEAMGITKLLRG